MCSYHWVDGACFNSAQQKKKHVFSSHLCFWSHLICEDKQGFRLAQYSWLLACCVKWAFIETKCPHVRLLQRYGALQSWPDESSALHSRVGMHRESRPAFSRCPRQQPAQIHFLFQTIFVLWNSLAFYFQIVYYYFVNKTLSSGFSLKDLYVHYVHRKGTAFCAQNVHKSAP